MKAGRVNWHAVHGRVLQIDNTKFNYCKSRAGKRMGRIYKDESVSFIRARIPSDTHSHCVCVCVCAGETKCPEKPACGDIYLIKPVKTMPRSYFTPKYKEEILMYFFQDNEPIFRTFKSVCILMLFFIIIKYNLHPKNYCNQKKYESYNICIIWSVFFHSVSIIISVLQLHHCNIGCTAFYLFRLKKKHIKRIFTVIFFERNH